MLDVTLNLETHSFYDPIEADQVEIDDRSSQELAEALIDTFNYNPESFGDITVDNSSTPSKSFSGYQDLVESLTDLIDSVRGDNSAVSLQLTPVDDDDNMDDPYEMTEDDIRLLRKTDTGGDKWDDEEEGEEEEEEEEEEDETYGWGEDPNDEWDDEWDEEEPDDDLGDYWDDEE